MELIESQREESEACIEEDETWLQVSQPVRHLFPPTGSKDGSEAIVEDWCDMWWEGLGRVGVQPDGGRKVQCKGRDRLRPGPPATMHRSRDWQSQHSHLSAKTRRFGKKNSFLKTWNYIIFLIFYDKIPNAGSPGYYQESYQK